MYKINLNCDLGEGAAYDEQIIPLINSANIACGFHAGNHDMMEATAKLCIDNNVDIGAHPGYPDKENFGRTNLDVTPKQVYDYTLVQLEALGNVVGSTGKIVHIKPHGAMYNQAAKNKELA
nr:LamB/YcsF family protein [Eubacterium sp.]